MSFLEMRTFYAQGAKPEAGDTQKDKVIQVPALRKLVVSCGLKSPTVSHVTSAKPSHPIVSALIWRGGQNYFVQ